MGLDRFGNVIFRDKFSRCEVCEYYISGYECWMKDYIDVMCWNGFDSHKCEKFNSTIDNHSSQFVFRDYEDLKLFPEKKFGGKFKFNKEGKIIGEL